MLSILLSILLSAISTQASIIGGPAGSAVTAPAADSIIGGPAG